MNCGELKAKKPASSTMPGAEWSRQKPQMDKNPLAVLHIGPCPGFFPGHRDRAFLPYRGHSEPFMQHPSVAGTPHNHFTDSSLFLLFRPSQVEVFLHCLCTCVPPLHSPEPVCAHMGCWPRCTRAHTSPDSLHRQVAHLRGAV